MSSSEPGRFGQAGEEARLPLAAEGSIVQDDSSLKVKRSSNSETSGSTAERQPAPFLQKTWNLVNDPSTDDVISWSSDGNSFVVWNAEQFSKKVLPTAFKHSNFSSFVRQLNIYGFKKLASGRHEFGHALFQRGNEALLRRISRSGQLPIGTPESMKSENMWLKTKLQQYMAYYELVVRQVEKWGVNRDVLSQQVGVALPAPEANMSLPLMVGRPLTGDDAAAQLLLSGIRQQPQSIGGAGPSEAAPSVLSQIAPMFDIAGPSHPRAQIQFMSNAINQSREPAILQQPAWLHHHQHLPSGNAPSEVLQRVKALAAAVEGQQHRQASVGIHNPSGLARNPTMLLSAASGEVRPGHGLASGNVSRSHANEMPGGRGSQDAATASASHFSAFRKPGNLVDEASPSRKRPRVSETPPTGREIEESNDAKARDSRTARNVSQGGIAAVPGPGTYGTGDLVQMVKQRILAARQATALLKLQRPEAAQQPQPQTSVAAAPTAGIPDRPAAHRLPRETAVSPSHSEDSRAESGQPRPLKVRKSLSAARIRVEETAAEGNVPAKDREPLSTAPAGQPALESGVESMNRFATGAEGESRDVVTEQKSAEKSTNP